MKTKYFAYVRVSSTRQGELGVSLPQQREAIERHALRSGLEIGQWLEEQETAAKRGRPIFDQMIKLLRRGDAVGVIMHKIDRSARNLRDWADLGELIDGGIEVHFANEALDLSSRGGRLSADIQAVVAADYIRNLREESIKGFYGRLKQGVLPRPAPIGYCNAGPGRPKTIDPERGSLVKQAFDFYATGRYCLRTLTAELNRLGLRSRKQSRVSLNCVHRMLKNPFYIGIIEIKGQTYKGAHEALVPVAIFNRVQDVLAGNRVVGTSRQYHIFSKFLRCSSCSRSLIADVKKGHTYYRCQTIDCPTTSFREEQIMDRVLKIIHDVALQPWEEQVLDDVAAERKAWYRTNSDQERSSLQLQLAAVAERQNRLTDALVDGTLEKADFEQRKTALLMQRREVEEKLNSGKIGNSAAVAEIDKFLELVKRPSLLAKGLNPVEMREWLEEAVSNREASPNSLVITLRKPLSAVAARPGVSSGRPRRNVSRIFWSKFLNDTIRYNKL